MVLHICAFVYLWYASNVATFIADQFASFMFYVIKIRKLKKKDIKCLHWSVEFVVIVGLG